MTGPPIVTFWLQWQNHEVPNGLSYCKYAWLYTAGFWAWKRALENRTHLHEVHILLIIFVKQIWKLDQGSRSFIIPCIFLCNVQIQGWEGWLWRCSVQRNVCRNQANWTWQPAAHWAKLRSWRRETNGLVEENMLIFPGTLVKIRIFFCQMNHLNIILSQV